MTTYRYIILFVALGLLSACGESEQEPAATVPEGVLEDSLSAETPAPAVATEDAQSVGGVDAAAFYASRCASCHGKNREGVAGNPSLVALTQEDIQSKLEIYRSGGSVGPKSAVMTPMVRNLSDADIEALAAHLGS